MIRTLRTRLVAAAMASLGVVLTVILGLVLLSSYQNIVSDADRILNLLGENQGEFPQLPPDFDWEAEGPRRQSPDTAITSAPWTRRQALVSSSSIFLT